MALNYGLSENFTMLVPFMNSKAIFDGINEHFQNQYPDPPNHSPMIYPSFVLNENSVLHLTNHNFKLTLPDTDNTILYYMVAIDANGTATYRNILEYVPVKAVTNENTYIIDKKIRIGDHFTQTEIGNNPIWRLGVKRKTGTGKLGGYINGSNELFFIVLSPLETIL